MVNINYEINNILFPFSFAFQHFAAIPQEAEWKGRIVHLIVGILECIPPINYIIAIFDSLFNNVPPVPVPHLPPAAPRAPLHQLPPKVVEDPKVLLGACLTQMFQGLAFGLTSGVRSMDENLRDLALRGIHSLEDLQALGLFEFDETLSQHRAFLSQFLEALSVPDNGKKGSDFCAQELADLEVLRKRAAPDLADRTYDRSDLHAVRSELCTIEKQLEEYVQQVLDSSATYPADYSLAGWREIQSNLQALEEPFAKRKDNWTGELDALVAIAKDVETQESGREQALLLSQKFEPMWNQLKDVVAEVTKHLEFLNEVEIGFNTGQHSDQEVAVFDDLRGRHRAAFQQLKDLSLALKEFNIEALQGQIEQLQGVLAVLEQYGQVEKIVLLRFYVNQVNGTTAWKTLNQQQSIRTLAKYQEIYPESNLYELGQTWA